MLKVWVGLEARKYLQNSAELVSLSIYSQLLKLSPIFTIHRWNCASNMISSLPTFRGDSCVTV